MHGPVQSRNSKRPSLGAKTKSFFGSLKLPESGLGPGPGLRSTEPASCWTRKCCWLKRFKAISSSKASSYTLMVPTLLSHPARSALRNGARNPEALSDPVGRFILASALIHTSQLINLHRPGSWRPSSSAHSPDHSPCPKNQQGPFPPAAIGRLVKPWMQRN